MVTYGYIRVSSDTQNTARQEIEVEKYGIKKRNIFFDNISGRDFERPGYQKLKSIVQPGDVIVIKSIDRLGRSYEGILEEWRDLINNKCVDIVILDMPLLNTTKNKDLMGTLISDIVLQLLCYVAQCERESIRQRQAEGIAAAKLRGQHLGRTETPIPSSFYPIYDQWINKEFTLQTASKELGITVSQFRTMIKKHNRNNSIS